ncbi:sensor histidine kinase [Novosphingobium sp.]|uniref:sensor histidine kinase n=1 Tax=Novosphingobium sp. TaxID=1874826 RepID=UPI003D0B55AF
MSTIVAVTGQCDADDRLIEADEALAGLQARCGGDLPGVLAVPALLALVRHTRVSGVAQSRIIGALDDGKPVGFLASVTPVAGGTHIELSQWRLMGDGLPDAAPVDVLLYQTAALHALLDTDQRVLSVDLRVPDGAEGDRALADLAAHWRADRDNVWSRSVELVGVAHRQPLHWRLIDDTAIRIPGSAQMWRARLLPRGDVGFDLLILPDAIGDIAETAAPRAEPEQSWSRMIGRDLAPALRQPINRIVANAETIRTRLAGPLVDEYAGYAADIAEAGRHLLALVEDLADLDAVEAPEFNPAPDRIDLSDCGRRAAGILAMRAAERGITLISPDEDHTIPATGEFRRVLQILLNLITNAIRYGPERSSVQIETGGDAQTAWVAVSDQGAGLSADQAAHVFDKFERLGRTGDGGSGLGLYISRRLARAMGGDLVVAQDGPGARFVLTLPGRANA